MAKFKGRAATPDAASSRGEASAAAVKRPPRTGKLAAPGRAEPDLAGQSDAAARPEQPRSTGTTVFGAPPELRGKDLTELANQINQICAEMAARAVPKVAGQERIGHPSHRRSTRVVVRVLDTPLQPKHFSDEQLAAAVRAVKR